jgi:hypothetical protein
VSPDEPPGARPRILVIVRRDEARLGDRLRMAFAGTPAVEVILDRRTGERRRRRQAVGADRRRGDRRWPTPSASEQELWALAGFRVVLRPHDIEVYEVFESGSDAEEER